MVCDQIHYPNNYLDSFPYTEHLDHYSKEDKNIPRSFISCKVCNVYLCISKNRNCFTDFHTLDS